MPETADHTTATLPHGGAGEQPGTHPPLVDVENLTIRFPVGRSGFWGGTIQFVHAVEDVTLDIQRGETLGLVGESGSGKTTLGRAILRRIDPWSGTIRFDGEDITQVTGKQLRLLRRRMQLVFQDPYASLNPRMNVLELVAEPLVVHGLVKDAAARPRRGSGSARALWAPGGHRRPLPARLQRRPTAADRHRPRAGAAARVHRRRRAGVGARRLGQGAGREPLAGPAAGAWPDIPVHRPRPLSRAPHLAPDRDSVRRPPRRDRRRPNRSMSIRSTRTPRRCSRASRFPIRLRSASAAGSC